MKSLQSMKVFYDHQIFSYQRIGGVSKYFAEILRRMPREMWDTSTWLSNNQYVKEYGLFDAKPFLPNKDFKGKSRIMLELGIPYTLYKLSKRDYDVYHQTHYERFSLCGIGNKPMITTFHDMNFFTINRNERLMRDTMLSLNRADKVIAISNNTKKGLINDLGVKEEKIVVIYHGVDKVQTVSCRTNKIFEFPYILYVGSRNQAFKNFGLFIKAFSIISCKYNDLHLVCTGKDFDKKENEVINELGIKGKCHTIFASEEELNRLYRDSLFFVYPSKSEGFGMPILEAMQNNCPCILADASCFPEIAQDAALYFNPNSIDELVAQMEYALVNPTAIEKLIKKGEERVSSFSWEKTASEHINVYKSVL